MTISCSEASPGQFAATPKENRAFDVTWTPRAFNEQDSDSSGEEGLISSEDADTLHVYNAAMSKLATSGDSTGRFSPLTTHFKTTWENTPEIDPKKCQEKDLQGCLVVCEVVASNARDDLFHALCHLSPNEPKDEISRELAVLTTTSYRDAPSKSVKLQILSLYANRFPAEKLMKYHEPYEPLTHWQIKQARKHAKEQGPGIPDEKILHHRVRLPMEKIDHFIDFINRPHFYQDVA